MPRAEFKIGTRVYLVGDPDNVRRQVVEVIETPIGYKYAIRIENELVEVYGIELSRKKDVVGNAAKEDDDGLDGGEQQ